MIPVSDKGKAMDQASVVRYQATVNIRRMMNDKQYVEAFVHAQMAIEKILWDKIVGIFNGEKAMKVRTAIDDWHKEERNRTLTFELLKWAHILGALDRDDYSDLTDFNKKRNHLLHGHGEWWFSESYTSALEKGIRFLEGNAL